MIPIIIQSAIKRQRQNRPTPDLDETIYVGKTSPAAKFVFWGLAAVILLSLLIA